MAMLPQKRLSQGSLDDWGRLVKTVKETAVGLNPSSVSNVGVEFEAEITHRREMGKKLIFLNVQRIAPLAQTAKVDCTDEGCCSEAARDDVAQEMLQVTLDQSRYYDQSLFFLHSALLRPGAHAHFDGFCGLSGVSNSIYCVSSRLTRAKPHPVFILNLIDHLRSGDLDAAHVRTSLGLEQQSFDELLGLGAREQRHACAGLARILQGRAATVNRIRKARVGDNEVSLLSSMQKLRDEWPMHVYEDQCSADAEYAATEGTEARAIEVSVIVPELEDEAERRRREEYAHGKKVPQIEWMIQRLRALLGTCVLSQGGGVGLTVVDVGGGRGDLAVNICRHLPAVERVRVVDVNALSLQAGRARAEELGLGAKMSFENQSVQQLMEETPWPEGRVVLVGLHACGGLTDALLRLARRHRAHFLAVPCCFLKLPDLRRWGQNARCRSCLWLVRSHACVRGCVRACRCVRAWLCMRAYACVLGAPRSNPGLA